MVVEVRPEDVENLEFRTESLEFATAAEGCALGNAVANSPLSTLNSQLRVLRFQEELERMCWQQGNMKQTAPAQRMADFVNNKLSYDLPKSSYAPGLISSPLHFWLPKMISKRLQEGFKTFGRQAHGFLTNEAL